MPINSRIGRLVQETIAMRQAKGKHSGSYANSLFGSINDLFYEFGLVSGLLLRKPMMKISRNETLLIFWRHIWLH